MNDRLSVVTTLAEKLLSLGAIHLALGARWPLAGLASLWILHVGLLVALFARHRMWRKNADVDANEKGGEP